MTEEQVIRKYLGVPYKHKGRSMEGLDCYGLGILLYKDLGYTLFDIKEYAANWSAKGANYLLENYYRQWEKVYSPSTFDAVMFKRTKDSILVNHGGFVLSDNRFIHCCKQGTIISKWCDEKWVPLLEGFYHLKERIK